MTKKLVVSLDEILSGVAGYVSVGGVEYPVLPITAPGMQLVERLQAGDQPTTEETIAECRKLCPTLPEAFWTDKPLAITGYILGVAQNIVEKVEAALPNSSGPATTSPTPAVESPAP